MRINKTAGITFLLPFFLSFSVVIISFFLVKEGYSKITSLQDQYNKLESKRELLENKLEELRRIDPNIIDKNELANLALPSTSGGPFVISNIRKIAQEKNIQVSNINLSSKGQAEDALYGADEITLVLTMESLVDLIETLKALYNTIPVATLKGVGVEVQAENVRASIVLSSYFSSLPTQLPALTEPINKLTPQDVAVLNKIINYQQPSTKLINPLGSDRRNPFI